MLSDNFFQVPFLLKAQAVEFKAHAFDAAFKMHGLARIGV